MDHFKAHRLRFVTQVQSTIELNEHQGSAIRGSLFHALRKRFCGNREAKECAACPLATTCPVATLVSTLKPGSPRGRDVPRPYTVQPPLPGQDGHRVEDEHGRLFFHYRPGERFAFGLTLYAQALQLFPYVVLTVKTFERDGIGRRMEREGGRWRRGMLTIQEVWAENPLTGERQAVIGEGDDVVQMPDIPVTHQQVMDVPTPAPGAPVRIGLRTPTRLVEGGELVKAGAFRFRPFIHRLLDRLEALSRDFSDAQLAVDFPALLERAEAVRVVENGLQWEELRSYSTRQRRSTPTSGLLGAVVLEADDWSPFWPWLVWGQFVHVGKDAVKGNGWYEVREEGKMENGKRRMEKIE